LTTFLSSLPAWQAFDPLPVLDSFEAHDEGDDESLESIVDNKGEIPTGTASGCYDR
jgi:hypothetical protein